MLPSGQLPPESTVLYYSFVHAAAAQPSPTHSHTLPIDALIARNRLADPHQLSPSPLTQLPDPESLCMPPSTI